MENILLSMVKSWAAKDSICHSTQEILAWIQHLNCTRSVNISKIRLEEDPDWFYDPQSGCIRNQINAFFQITGLNYDQDGMLLHSQPIILQPEIGYLGILCKEICGVLHFLMQAKIEPGNVNKIQISPTIQATKSNFTQLHGGKAPAYLEYFTHADQHQILVDQIQSEQSSRFYRKRNRNILIKVQGEVEESPNHWWMTLGQIKALMRFDNIVNMDTRTVISCIPFSQIALEPAELDVVKTLCSDACLYRSIFEPAKSFYLPEIFHFINNYRMFHTTQARLVPLSSLAHWEFVEGEFVCRDGGPFKIIFCDISIEGREVKRWTQPLFEATTKSTFGLITCVVDGVLQFLIHAKSEPGCLDMLELGPTVQLEMDPLMPQDPIEQFFFQQAGDPRKIVHRVVLSEEGGRFYHEQNDNMIIRVDQAELPALPKGYFLVDYRTLNTLVQINNCLNIQLRNLLSLLEV